VERGDTGPGRDGYGLPRRGKRGAQRGHGREFPEGQGHGYASEGPGGYGYGPDVQEADGYGYGPDGDYFDGSAGVGWPDAGMGRAGRRDAAAPAADDDYGQLLRRPGEMPPRQPPLLQSQPTSSTHRGLQPPVPPGPGPYSPPAPGRPRTAHPASPTHLPNPPTSFPPPQSPSPGRFPPSGAPGYPRPPQRNGARAGGPAYAGPRTGGPADGAGRADPSHGGPVRGAEEEGMGRLAAGGGPTDGSWNGGRRWGGGPPNGRPGRPDQLNRLPGEGGRSRANVGWGVAPGVDQPRRPGPVGSPGGTPGRPPGGYGGTGSPRVSGGSLGGVVPPKATLRPGFKVEPEPPGPVIRQREAGVPEDRPLGATQPAASIAPDGLEAFARDLRALRTKAGLDYTEMAEISHYTMKTLVSAAGGLRLPTLPVAVAYVRACGGDPAEWEERWQKLATKIGADAAKKPRNPGDEAPASPPEPVSEQVAPESPALNAAQKPEADPGEVYVITSAKPRHPGW
jgi:Helix-turn-helix domain